MHNLGILFRKLYMSKIKSGGFIFTTILYLLAVFLFFFMQDASQLISNTVSPMNQVRIGVVDQSGLDILPIFQSKDSIVVEEGKTDIAQLKDGSVDAIVTITSLSDQGMQVRIQSDEPLGFNKQLDLESYVKSLTPLAMSRVLGINADQIKEILSIKPSIETTNLQTQQKSIDEKGFGMMISYVISIAIFMMLMVYISMIVVDVSMEKGTKILDILLSSVTPTQHILSKILSVFALALTQLILLSVFALILLSSKGIPTMINLNSLSPMYVISCILYLFGALLLYLSISALLGSMVNRPEEGNQIISPLMLLLVVGFYTGMFGMFQPDFIWVKIASFIPFFSSMVMPLRLSTTDMPAWENIVSLVLLYATTALGVYMSIRFYRHSVLMDQKGGLLKKISYLREQ